MATMQTKKNQLQAEMTKAVAALSNGQPRKKQNKDRVDDDVLDAFLFFAFSTTIQFFLVRV